MNYYKKYYCNYDKICQNDINTNNDKNEQRKKSKCLQSMILTVS